MPKLDNARHELFAQNVASGCSFTEAYRNSGYDNNPTGASRLAKRADVKARIAELQQDMALILIARAGITLEKLTTMLLEDRECSLKNGNGGHARACTHTLGLLHGYAFEPLKEANQPKPAPLPKIEDAKVIDFKLANQRYSVPEKPEK